MGYTTTRSQVANLTFVKKRSRDPIRVSEAVWEALKKIQLEAQVAKPLAPPPSFASILDKAWAAYVAIEDKGSISKDGAKPPPPSVIPDTLLPNGIVLESDDERQWVHRLVRALRARKQSPLVANAVEQVLLLSEAALAGRGEGLGDAQTGSPQDEALLRNASQAVTGAGGSLRNSNETKARTKRVLGVKGADREQAG